MGREFLGLKITVLLVCVLVIGYFESTKVFAIDKDIDSLVAGNNSFAFDLYKQLAENKGNFFFSPYSISSALAMTYAGARGETAKQMANTLHFNLVPEKLHSSFSSLTKLFNESAKNYQLSVANALWGQIGYKLSKEFLDITNKYYDAGFKEVDYIDDTRREQTRQTINKWVEERTNNKIKNLIGPRDLTNLTRLVLTNAIYFKGKWEVQFNPSDTKVMPFYITEKEKIDTPMMYQLARFNYTENDKLQILEMPYTGGNLSMVILLPKHGYALSKIEDMLSLEKVQSWLSHLSKEKVEVFLPKFKLEKRFELNKELQDLGMIDAFEEGLADFSGMNPDRELYISKVIHQSFVEVNEEGTEAAAATAVIMNGKSIEPEPYVFRADRPFIFLIRDLRSENILFMGRLVDPR